MLWHNFYASVSWHYQRVTYKTFTFRWWCHFSSLRNKKGHHHTLLTQAMKSLGIETIDVSYLACSSSAWTLTCVLSIVSSFSLCLRSSTNWTRSSKQASISSTNLPPDVCTLSITLFTSTSASSRRFFCPSTSGFSCCSFSRLILAAVFTRRHLCCLWLP